MVVVLQDKSGSHVPALPLQTNGWRMIATLPGKVIMMVRLRIEQNAGRAGDIVI
jgi:hypothetical protein